MSPRKPRYIYRRCITLKNGKRICRPRGKAFRIPIKESYKPPRTLH